jgi:hypothetical protein
MFMFQKKRRTGLSHTQVDVPPLGRKCGDRGERPVHDETPAQEDEVEPVGFAIDLVVDGRGLDGDLVRLLALRGIELGWFGGEMRFRSLVLSLRRCGGTATSAPVGVSIGVSIGRRCVRL